ncbi:MAG: Zn-dependent hydrolase [Acidiferrobacterales bacterium]
MTDDLRINGERLWRSLTEMAKIGATPKGGVCRLALSDVDKTGRDLFKSWCEAAGCTIIVDQMGNMFVRRPGREASRPPIGMGSHLDSQPTGGKFDGVYGVLAALEVVRTLNDHAVETQAPIEVVVWTNEEGARFAPAMVGSGVFAGVFELDYAWGQKDRDGISISEALDRIGYKGDALPGDHQFGAFFEVHIEQGPILETEGKTIGIVKGVQGMRWYDVALIGEEAHAGPTPMERRRDSLAGATQLLPKIYQLALDRQPFGRATIAQFRTYPPGSRNTVPSRAEFSVDLRHPDADQLAEMDAGLRAITAQVATDRGLEHSITHVWEAAPVSFNPACVDAVRNGAEIMGYPAMEIVSGAGHDSVYISGVAPTGMIFVPCERGISHNETESATPEDIAAGANVLLQAVLQHAQRTS